MRVSVVVCTYNRASSLAQTIESLRSQRFSAMEVVVVNGPSTDNTADVLATFVDEVKIRTCPAANLSMSRNIGIQAASGDIVAFIDDDALPEFNWLSEALTAFDSDEVAGVGGIVFDHTGMALQYRFSAADRFGNATFADTPFDDRCTPGSASFPYLQGTNALFRRTALEEVGGFDETFDYYLDETDLCCRLVDAGFRLRQLERAPVHHKFLASGVRNHNRVITNWYPMVKNHVYFGLRHGVVAGTELDAIDSTRRFIAGCLADVEHHERAGRLAPGAAEEANRTMSNALVDGIAIGRERGATRLPRLTTAQEPFLPFASRAPGTGLRIGILSGDYPPNVTGGVARFLGDVAPALARLGHEVRVITRAPDTDPIGTVDLEDGVWVHRVPATEDRAGLLPAALPHVDAFATASAAELARLQTFCELDVVYGPVWDVEVLAAIRTTALPVVAMLATPVTVAVRDASENEQLRVLLDLEREVFVRADAVHAISTAIVDTINHHYPGSLDEDRVVVAPIGLADRALATRADSTPDSSALTVLYTGRLEPRKGTDVLLRSIERLAPRHPNVNWVLIGDDNEVDAVGASPSRQWVDTHRSADWIKRVQFLGAVDDTTLHARYGEADIVVVPSRYESFGLVAVEAMMHGKPIISSDVGGIPEVVRHRVDGVLVAPGDPDQLAEAIDRMLSDHAERAAMGTAARERFERHLGIDVAARRLDAVMSSIAARRPSWGDATATDVERRPGGAHMGARSALTITRAEPWSVLLHATRDARILVSADGTQVLRNVAAGERTAITGADAVPVTVEVVGGEIVAGLRPDP